MGQFVIRDARPGDGEAMAELFHAGIASYAHWLPTGWKVPARLESPADMEKAIARDDVWARIAEEDGRPVAFAAVKPATTERGGGDPIPGLGHLWMLFVARAAWGRGLGRALLEEATEALRSMGFGEARLVVASGNERGVKLYERAGWQARGSVYEPLLDLWITEYRRPL